MPPKNRPEATDATAPPTAPTVTLKADAPNGREYRLVTYPHRHEVWEDRTQLEWFPTWVEAARFLVNVVDRVRADLTVPVIVCGDCGRPLHRDADGMASCRLHGRA